MLMWCEWEVNMKTLGDSHWIERGNSLKNNNIFLRIKQFVQKNKCNLCKKTIFLCKIAVALRMDWVQRAPQKVLQKKQQQRRTPYGLGSASILQSQAYPQSQGVALRMDWVQRVSGWRGNVALRMECVDLSLYAKSHL